MRFIRKGGRIIPIRNNQEQYAHQARTDSHKGAAAQGAAIGVAGVSAQEALIHGARAKSYARAGNAAKAASSLKFSNGSKKVALGALGASMIAGTYAAVKAGQAQKAEGPTSFGKKIKESLKQVGATAAGFGAVIGIRNATLKAGPKVKKVVGAVKEEFKFRSAKKVKHGFPVRGLLK